MDALTAWIGAVLSTKPVDRPALDSADADVIGCLDGELSDPEPVLSSEL